MSCIGTKIIDAIIEGALCSGQCAHDTEHGVVITWSSGAMEQIEALVSEYISAEREKDGFYKTIVECMDELDGIDCVPEHSNPLEGIRGLCIVIDQLRATLAERDKELAEANARVAKCIHELGEPDYTVIEKLTAQLLAAQTVIKEAEGLVREALRLDRIHFHTSAKKQLDEALLKLRSPDPTLLDEVVKVLDYIRLYPRPWLSGTQETIDALATKLLSRLRQSTRETEREGL